MTFDRTFFTGANRKKAALAQRDCHLIIEQKIHPNNNVSKRQAVSFYEIGLNQFLKLFFEEYAHFNFGALQGVRYSGGFAQLWGSWNERLCLCKVSK